MHSNRTDLKLSGKEVSSSSHEVVSDGEIRLSTLVLYLRGRQRKNPLKQLLALHSAVR